MSGNGRSWCSSAGRSHGSESLRRRSLPRQSCLASLSGRSKVTGFGGGGLPVVIAAVRVLDRRLREFFVRRIVQAGDVDRVKFAAKRGKRAALGERPDT